MDSTQYTYGWPVKPFHAQHPVRGFFGDPRVSNQGRTRQFHFGVDVSAPDGTPVYATLTGIATIHPLHASTVIANGAGGVEFSYWHVVPTIRNGQRVVAYRTVIGHILEGQDHVHFSEARGSWYLNPLRPGAMGPFADDTRPYASRITTESAGRLVSPKARGSFDLVAELRDETPIAVPRPWHDLPVMPALVRWRLLGAIGTDGRRLAHRGRLPADDPPGLGVRQHVGTGRDAEPCSDAREVPRLPRRIACATSSRARTRSRSPLATPGTTGR